MKSVIYYRRSLFKEELNSAQKYFSCVDLLTNINKNELVIPRFSMFPFFLDQEREIKNVGAKLINSYNQHLYVADLKNYVNDLKELTPQTWFRLEDIPETGPFILKGETNSRKNNWNKFMFASNKKEAIEIHSRLCEDTLISQQNIYIRKYIPLVSYMNGIGGAPISKEFRIFICYGKIVYKSYYWTIYSDELSEVPNPNEIPEYFINKVISIIGDNINFYCIDVAQTQSGEWIVIELNDGISAGLPDLDQSDEFYLNLKKNIDEKNA